MTGTPKTTAIPAPITRETSGTVCAWLIRPANMAPTMAKLNATPNTDRFDHAAKVGRERGSESPIAVSPYRRIAVSPYRHPDGAQRRLYETVNSDQLDSNPGGGAHDPVLNQPRPTCSGDGADSDQVECSQDNIAAQPPDHRTPAVHIGRFQCAEPIDVMIGGPLLWEAAPHDAGKKDHPQSERYDGNGDHRRLNVVTRVLEGDDPKRQQKINRQHHGERDYTNRPRISCPAPIPGALPNAFHSGTVDATPTDLRIFARSEPSLAGKGRQRCA